MSTQKLTDDFTYENNKENDDNNDVCLKGECNECLHSSLHMVSAIFIFIFILHLCNVL